jgi:hypothetical protein
VIHVSEVELEDRVVFINVVPPVLKLKRIVTLRFAATGKEILKGA